MATSLSYDQLVQKLLDDGTAVSKSEAKRRITLQEARKMREGDGGKELKEIRHDSPEGMAMRRAANPEQNQGPKRRGRPKSSRNRPKA